MAYAPCLCRQRPGVCRYSRGIRIVLVVGREATVITHRR